MAYALYGLKTQRYGCGGAAYSSSLGRGLLRLLIAEPICLSKSVFNYPKGFIVPDICYFIKGILKAFY